MDFGYHVVYEQEFIQLGELVTEQLDLSTETL